MTQEPKLPPLRHDSDDGRHPIAATALFISLGAVIVSWFVFRGEAPSENEVVVVMVLIAALAVVAWRMGRGR